MSIVRRTRPGRRTSSPMVGEHDRSSLRDEQDRHPHGMNAKQLAVHAAAVHRARTAVIKQNLRLADETARGARGCACRRKAGAGRVLGRRARPIEPRRRAAAVRRRHGAAKARRDVPYCDAAGGRPGTANRRDSSLPGHRCFAHDDHLTGVRKDEARGHVEQRGRELTARNATTSPMHIEADVAQDLSRLPSAAGKFWNILKMADRRHDKAISAVYRIKSVPLVICDDGTQVMPSIPEVICAQAGDPA